MLLYHGSKWPLTSLKPSQAENADPANHKPEGELLHAIYFTPQLGFAIAMACRPPGLTEIENNKKQITFEHPEMFDPEQDIFVYQVQSDGIPKENIREVDERIIAITDLPELTIDGTQKLKAKEVIKYYELLNWHEREKINELKRK